MEAPLLRLLYMRMPSKVHPRSIADMLLKVDCIVNTTAALDVVPAVAADYAVGASGIIEGTVGELVVDGRVDDRWIVWAAHLSDQLSPHNKHWNWRCDKDCYNNMRSGRRPMQVHLETFTALQEELTLLWRIAREQDYAGSVSERIHARCRTTIAILALAEATGCRLTRRDRDELAGNAEALKKVLTENVTRLQELKEQEKLLSVPSTTRFEASVVKRRVQVGLDYIELEKMYECELSRAADVAGEKRRAFLASGKQRHLTATHTIRSRLGLRSAVRRTRSGKHLGR